MSGEDSASSVRIRRIAARDEPVVEQLIATVLGSFRGGSAETPDPATRWNRIGALARADAASDQEFYVVEDLSVAATPVRGCGGFGPLPGVESQRRICELQRMYFAPELRGRGAGRQLLEMLLTRMRVLGYRECYLETTAAMQAARRLYASAGFVAAARMGATGHPGCELPLWRQL